MNRVFPMRAGRLSGGGRRCRHQFELPLSRSATLRRFDLTFFTTYSNGFSYRAASDLLISVPKSMIHLFRLHPVRSDPLAHGRTTSEFRRPFGFVGALSIAAPSLACRSKAPPFWVPIK